MELTTKHIGAYGGTPAKIIELTVSGFNGTLEEVITDLNQKADEDFIISLRELADELEEHNNLLEANSSVHKTQHT